LQALEADREINRAAVLLDVKRVTWIETSHRVIIIF